MENCKSETALGQGLRRRANIQLERTQDRFRAHLQGADKQLLLAMTKNATSRITALMDGAIRQVRQTGLAEVARSNSTAACVCRSAKTAEMGGLDGSGQQNADQT